MFSSDFPASTIDGRVRRGELVRLRSGVYTTEVDRDPKDVVREYLFEIVGRLVPRAVITDRSARTGLPVHGVLYLARTGRARDIELPGVDVRVRAGARPQADDVRYPGGLYLASRPRGLAENTMPSRSRGGRESRTLNIEELGDWVDFIRQNEGAARLQTYREQAEDLAEALGVAQEHLSVLQGLIGIAVGTQPDETPRSPALAARQAGRPVDQIRVRRFETLARALQSAAPQSRPIDPENSQDHTYLPFFEAYFSNFIEGTEFEVDEAAKIVFQGLVPNDRPADAHDIVGTYRILASSEIDRTGQDEDEFIDLLKQKNAQIMEGRPEKRPGQFKELGNRAGATQFVDPALVEGTLAAGFRLRDSLDTAWERAVYVMFVISEVHPFDDGNGRSARAMMSSELVAGRQCRIIVPTVFRQDYLDGLRMLSRQDDPSVFIKAMRYAQNFTASIDFAEYDEAKEQLADANAFEEPNSAHGLRVPRTFGPVPKPESTDE